eukprot:4638013-Pyramimonas_sp.AAC.1
MQSNAVQCSATHCNAKQCHCDVMRSGDTRNVKHSRLFLLRCCTNAVAGFAAGNWMHSQAVWHSARRGRWTRCHSITNS